MEKVLRIRVRGTALDENEEEYTVGSSVYRFIGDEEVNNAEKQLVEEWKHYSTPQIAPYELHFKFERMDIGKEINYSMTREFIDDGQGLDSLVKRIRKAVDEQ